MRHCLRNGENSRDLVSRRTGRCLGICISEPEMKRETVKRRLYMSAVLLSLRRSDVGPQETGYAASCGPGTEKCANESAAKARSGALGGNTQDEQGCRPSTWSDSEPHNSTPGAHPPC